MKIKRCKFTVWFRTEYGLAVDIRKCKLDEYPEETFKNAWCSLPKYIDKTKESIEWEQDGNKYFMSFDLFKEANFNFDESVEISNIINENRIS